MKYLIGQSIGRYHIIEHLGEGGMADVYKAFDTQLERDVAIKVIRTDAFPANAFERVLKRFEREAKSQAKMSHPNIVKVFDFGTYENTPYLVMEYLPGGTLTDQMGQPMAWAAAAALLVPIAQALNYAHTRGVLHRDVKPANILITEEGRPMLTDFGIAKLLEDDSGHTLTGTGVGIGTPEYMAPEQGLGNEVDGRADVYALGVVLYELVTGRKPYSASTPMAVLLKQINDPLPRPRDLIADLPEQVERIIFKALAKDPEDRYADMGQFVKALENSYEEKERFTKELVEKSEPEKAGIWVQETTFESVKKDTEIDKPDDEVPPKKRLSIGWILAGIGIVGLLIPFSYPLIKNYSGSSPTATLNIPVTKASLPSKATPKPLQIQSSSTPTSLALDPSITFTSSTTPTTILSPTLTVTPEKFSNILENSKKGASATIDGEWLYFVGIDDHIHREHLDGSDQKKLTDQICDEFIVDNGLIYFIDWNLHSDFFRMNLDGSELIRLNNDSGWHLVISGNWIYYINLDDGYRITRLRLDGSNKEVINMQHSSDLNILGEWIYYINIDDGLRITRMHLDGSSREVINKQRSSDLIIVRDWIYFINYDDGLSIYRIHLDGSDQQKLNDVQSSDFVIHSDSLYFINDSQGGIITRMQLDGNNQQKLNNEKSSNLAVSGEWIYFRNHYDLGKMYKLNVDGHEQTKLNNDDSYITNIVGDWIIYWNSSQKLYYRIKSDGTGRVALQ